MDGTGKDSTIHCQGAALLWLGLSCKSPNCPGSRGASFHRAAVSGGQRRRCCVYHSRPALAVLSLQLVPHPPWNLHCFSSGQRAEKRQILLLGWGMQTRAWCPVTATASSSGLHSRAFQPHCKDRGAGAGFQAAACQELWDSLSFPPADIEHSSLKAALTARRKAAHYLTTLVNFTCTLHLM